MFNMLKRLGISLKIVTIALTFESNVKEMCCFHSVAKLFNYLTALLFMYLFPVLNWKYTYHRCIISGPQILCVKFLVFGNVYGTNI